MGEARGRGRLFSQPWTEMNPVKLTLVEVVRGPLFVLTRDQDQDQDQDPGVPGVVPPTPDTLSVLPGFRRASPSDTKPGVRLEARSKSRNKMPWIKSISPRAPAKFHQVPGAQRKGVFWGTCRTPAPRIPWPG